MTEEDNLGEGILTSCLKKGLKEFMKLYYILCEIIYGHMLISGESVHSIEQILKGVYDPPKSEKSWCKILWNCASHPITI